jgi:hypothetical protein
MKHLLLCIFSVLTFLSTQAQSSIKVDTTLRQSRQEIISGVSTIELKQNFPNPFNKTTRIDFIVPDNRMVEFKVYDMLGHLITSKFIDSYAGNNYIILERENMLPGFYFYSIQSGGNILTKRLMIKD